MNKYNLLSNKTIINSDICKDCFQKCKRKKCKGYISITKLRIHFSEPILLSKFNFISDIHFRF